MNKNNTLIGTEDRSKHHKSPSLSSVYGDNRMPDDDDQGPVLVVIALIIFFAVIIGLFATAVRAAEQETATPTVEVSKDSTPAQPLEKFQPPRDWKPPVAKIPELPPLVDEEKAKEIAEKWGIELVRLRLTAGNYMIDFRFHVLDVEKAKIFFDHRVKPYLHVEKSNAKLPVPEASKVGAFRTTNRGKNIQPNKTYYIIFGNPDAHVKPGEKVTMVFGDFKAENLTVH